MIDNTTLKKIKTSRDMKNIGNEKEHLESNNKDQFHQASTVTPCFGRKVRVPNRFWEAASMNAKLNQHVGYSFQTAKVIAHHNAEEHKHHLLI